MWARLEIPLFWLRWGERERGREVSGRGRSRIILQWGKTQARLSGVLSISWEQLERDEIRRRKIKIAKIRWWPQNLYGESRRRRFKGEGAMGAYESDNAQPRTNPNGTTKRAPEPVHPPKTALHRVTLQRQPNRLPQSRLFSAVNISPFPSVFYLQNTTTTRRMV